MTLPQEYVALHQIVNKISIRYAKRNGDVRTTLDIDGPILRELKNRQAKEGKSLGRLVSDLLAHALKEETTLTNDSPRAWIAKPMGARVNLSDKEAVHKVLDR